MPRPKLHRDHAARQAAYRRRQEVARERERGDTGLPPLPVLATVPGHARWTQAIAQAQSLLTCVVEEMQAYFDERSEAWQESERGNAHQERIEAVQEVVETLEAVWT